LLLADHGNRGRSMPSVGRSMPSADRSTSPPLSRYEATHGSSLPRAARSRFFPALGIDRAALGIDRPTMLEPEGARARHGPTMGKVRCASRPARAARSVFGAALRDLRPTLDISGPALAGHHTTLAPASPPRCPSRTLHRTPSSTALGNTSPGITPPACTGCGQIRVFSTDGTAVSPNAFLPPALPTRCRDPGARSADLRTTPQAPS
jgi:hypothetical protein